MKYRIKDLEQRRAVLKIFGHLAGAIPAEAGMRAQLSLDVPGVLIHPLTAELELEPVPDKCQWNAYHNETLAPETDYVVTYRDSVSGKLERGVTRSKKSGKLSSMAGTIIAWLEIPDFEE